MLADRVASGRRLVDGILSFDKDGSLISATPLHLSIHMLEKLAVFGNGRFFVTGFNEAKAAPPHIPGKPITEKQIEGHESKEPPIEPIGFVVSRHGDLIKRVKLPEDPLSVRHGKAYGPALRLSGLAEGFESVAAGNDGNIYAMFPTSEPIVYVISPDGLIVRSFFVPLPAHYTALAMRWAWGFNGLLLESAEIENHGATAEHTLFSVVDPGTGEVVGNYRAGAKLGTVPGCFTQQNIYFLGSDKGKLVMREADIR